jgi:hypothetical protein
MHFGIVQLWSNLCDSHGSAIFLARQIDLDHRFVRKHGMWEIYRWLEKICDKLDAFIFMSSS